MSFSVPHIKYSYNVVASVLFIIYLIDCVSWLIIINCTILSPPRGLEFNPKHRTRQESSRNGYYLLIDEIFSGYYGIDTPKPVPSFKLSSHGRWQRDTSVHSRWRFRHHYCTSNGWSSGQSHGCAGASFRLF